MKQLLLVRHAKAEKAILNIKDFDRSLNKKGYRDAFSVGRIIKEKNLSIDSIISSKANRAAQTADCILNKLALPRSFITYKKDLYHISLQDIVQSVKKLENLYNCIAIVGHNPTLTFLVEYLTYRENIYLRTSEVVLISFRIDEWKEIRQHTGTIEWIEHPQN